MKKSNQCIITTTWEYGAGKQGTSLGPINLLEACKHNHNHPFSHCNVFSVPQEIEEKEKIPLPTYLKRGEAFLKHQNKLAHLVQTKLTENQFPVILSGDHSNAVGGLAGFSKHFGATNSGIIWIDAHLDLHSPYTTPSGNIHGMALNTALNYDNLEQQINVLDANTITLWEKIKSLKNNQNIQIFDPKNIVFIGIRSYEEQEIELTKKLGIQVITAEEVHEKGIEAAWQKAKERLSKTSQIYVSFDVDSLDPSISIGTGTPVENGLSLDQASKLLHHLYHWEKCKTLEITEINPTLEDENAMALAICNLFQDVMA
jgi:arginase